VEKNWKKKGSSVREIAGRVAIPYRAKDWGADLRIRKKKSCYFGDH